MLVMSLHYLINVGIPTLFNALIDDIKIVITIHLAHYLMCYDTNTVCEYTQVNDKMLLLNNGRMARPFQLGPRGSKCNMCPSIQK